MMNKLDVNKVIEFIDGDKFDELLNKGLKGLFFMMMFFCVPYFIYLLLSI